MKTDKLAKLYDVLAPRERLSLLYAAEVREDWSEQERLIRSAPRIRCSVPDFYPHVEGLWLVGTLHMIEMLECGTYLWAASALWVNDRLDARKQEKARQAMGFHAYRSLILLDGWRLWGTQLEIDLDTLLKRMPAYDLLLRMEAFAREAAWTAEEATAYQGGEPAPTAASVAAELQKALNIWISKRG